MSGPFEAWIEEWLPSRAEALELLALDTFLQASEGFEFEPGERLRKLAIAVEGRAIALEPRRGWACVERIYARALELAPDHAWIHESRAITASFMAECADGLDDLVREAERCIARAAELPPDDAMIAYHQGHVIYQHQRWSAARALPHFERALSLDPACGWAALFRAHCLHDLER